MKKFKKAALTAASYVSVAALAIGGTLAFNYDDESKINTLEVGDAVDILINEYQRNDKKDALEDFEQLKELYPIVGSAQADADGKNMDGFGMPKAENYGDKIVTIDNIGQADAFIRVFVAKPLALSDLAKDGDKNTSDDALHMNLGNRVNLKGNYDDAYGDKWKENWGWQYNVDVFEAEIDGEKYEVCTFITTNPLKKGIESTAVIAGVYLDSSVDYDNGVYTMGDYTLDYDFSNGINIPVYAEAVAAADGMTWEDAFKDRNAKEVFATWASANNGISVDVNAENAEDALTEDKSTIIINLTEDITYDVAAWANNSMGGKSTEDIIINGNGHTITFNQTNSDWNNIATTNDAVLTIKDAHITNAGKNDGPWNRHDLNFDCPVVLKDVTSDKAIALKDSATFDNVTISDANTSDTYALWIQPNGQTVTLDGCTIDMIDCTDGRGIKIDEQYLDNPSKVTLNISDTTFKTEEKSAIIVKSVAGANIVLDNIDISGVAADTKNAVWVDEASTDYYDLVTVTGGNKIQEP